MSRTAARGDSVMGPTKALVTGNFPGRRVLRLTGLWRPTVRGPPLPTRAAAGGRWIRTVTPSETCDNTAEVVRRAKETFDAKVGVPPQGMEAPLVGPEPSVAAESGLGRARRRARRLAGAGMTLHPDHFADMAEPEELAGFFDAILEED